MADRISDLPDSVICYILSFLPTKISVSTSLLSKRWQPLWRSVPAFDFHYYRDSISKPINRDIVHWMNAFLHSRDPLQSLRRFCLECNPVEICGKYHPENVYELVSAAAVQHRLEHLQIYLPYGINFPSVVFTCKTLVVLKLLLTELNHFSSVDLPSLKTLYLRAVSFPDHRFFADLLSGCPNLEDIDVCCSFLRFKSSSTDVKLKILPKLVRATVSKNIIPLEVVSHVQSLCIEKMGMEVKIEDLIPQFPNLTRIAFKFWGAAKNWQQMFEVIEHCPKLQHLVIYQRKFKCEQVEDDSRPDWQCPLRVPPCISSRLETCRIVNYGDYQAEFEFAKYIMQNATVLKKMAILTYTRRKLTYTGRRRKMLKMKEKLSLFSSTCKLSIKYNM